MRVRARRQGNNDSYQQENHDELGMFNHEGDHGITLTVARSGYFSSPPVWKISTVPWRKCEVDHRRLIHFDPSWKGEGVFLPLHPRQVNWRGFYLTNCRRVGKASYLTEK
jgi:hypothetical protein